MKTKISMRERIAYAMMVSAVVAGVPNYLWLIGVMQRPSDELMAARWIYEGVIIFAAAFVGWFPV